MDILCTRILQCNLLGGFALVSHGRPDHFYAGRLSIEDYKRSFRKVEKTAVVVILAIFFLTHAYTRTAMDNFFC